MNLLLNAGISVIDYNAISIEFLDFAIPEGAKNAIFTSQNSVRAMLAKNLLDKAKDSPFQSIFCVGEKTKRLLEEHNQKVSFFAQNGSELANFIVNNDKNKLFHYFCGTRRRDELPEILKNENIELFEVKSYKTELNPIKFDQLFNGILFFSPSGVESFCLHNSMGNSMAFCIGETTASEAKKHTHNIKIANAATVESVIAKAVKILKEND
ncbi:uroporphyrinogen-III synthase [Constantimarinum furrinae]|uniref:Uroporphyrinogen-III synthase n=2 Tax=Constantimarinum furrinae TaxID=2562285 RepID=A0A7G8PSU9_9FLAO|nr:uroporphyrinogen-III synthase [Constantimarinum furrinae]